MILTPRLLKIAKMVNFKTAADIGTDHAKLPVYLVEKEICRKVVASDVADGPVLACKKSVALSGFSEQIDIRKGDGLRTLKPGEVETVIIAGMGGDLISRILNNSDDVCEYSKEIILQPMTHIIQLRMFLKQNNFKILDEALVKEKDKIYTIIRVIKGENQYNRDIDYIISPTLIANKDPLLGEYVKGQIQKYKKEFEGLKSAAEVDEKAVSKIGLIISDLEKIYETTKNY